MAVAVAFFLAYGLAFVLTTAFYPALQMGPRLRLGVIVLLGIAIVATPLLIPVDAAPARFVVACLAPCFVLKMVDLHIGALHGRRPDLRTFLAFLGNPLQLVERRTGTEPQPSRAQNARDYLLSLCGMLLAFGAFRWAGVIDWSQRAFLWEHIARAGTFFVFVLFLFRNMTAVLRAVGVYSVDPVRHPLRARTPAEFWRHYNRWMGQFLQEDVFKPLNGRRYPRRATMMVFAVSGLLHEYVFLIATGRVQGYQMLFFLIQGAAVTLTLRAKPVGATGMAWTGATLVFNLLSAMLFFASWQGLGRFYPTGLPPWLPQR